VDDNATRTDNGIITHVGHDDAAVTQPRVATNVNGSELATLISSGMFRVGEVMLSATTQDIHITADEHRVTDDALTKNATGTNVNLLANEDITVREEGSKVDVHITGTGVQRHHVIGTP
jgi:hypothetical protein